MSKNIIEISDSEKLVLFEFLNRIINEKTMNCQEICSKIFLRSMY